MPVSAQDGAMRTHDTVGTLRSEVPIEYARCNSHQMKGNAGVWIDHRKAVVVVLASGEKRVTTIASKVEKHPERSGDSPLKGSYEAAQVQADDVRQRTFTAKLAIYYDAVIAALHEATSIIIFGPGEAKGELHKRLIEHKLGGLVAAVETQDKMTDWQIAAKVRSHFARGVTAQMTPKA
jgi:hypothetical protein